MPQLLQNIDQIARQKQRDVLTLKFHDRAAGFMLDYHQNESRKMILEWFIANDIPHYKCGPYASETWMESYHGQIYIDVPYDKSNPMFRKVASFLKNPDGSMKFEGAWFCYLPLDICMKNAHHDEPGFWEKWAEGF